MFHTTTPRRNTSVALAAVVVIGLGSLTACQTGAKGAVDQSTRPTVHSTPIPTQYTGMPADRIADALERESARTREIAERFHGVPADRIEEQLAREKAE